MLLLILVQGIATTNADDWEFEITPYLWTAGIDADIGPPLRPASVDVSFSDYLELIDIGAAFIFEAKKGKWDITSDVLWLKLSEGLEAKNGVVDFENEQLIFESQFGYQAFDYEPLRIVGGFRYMDITTDLEFNDKVSVEISDDFIDPYAGLRWRSFVSDKWELDTQVDIGGGNDADLVLAGFITGIYHINEKFNIKMGYRILDIDFESDDLVFDGTLEGIQIGLGIRF